jgi:hypothetical protein
MSQTGIYGWDPTIFLHSPFYVMLIGVGASSTTTYRNVATVLSAVSAVGGFVGGILACIRLVFGPFLKIKYENSLITQMFIYSDKQ